jgi:hypothetical protein
MITFKCNYCGANLRIADNKAGTIGKCPGCQGAITVPAVMVPDLPRAVPVKAISAGLLLGLPRAEPVDALPAVPVTDAPKAEFVGAVLVSPPIPNLDARQQRAV